MPGPPSIMSFYADVPRANKETRPLCDAKPSNATIFNNASECVCATNLRHWYPCTEHPWEERPMETFGESFSMVDCNDTSRSFEIHVQRNPKVLARPEIIRRKAASEAQRPNVLVLELDSVSTAYSDRHMPCLLYTSPSPRDQRGSRMPSSA